MSTLLPPQFLFRYAIPVHYAKVPKSGKRPLALSAEYALPALSQLGAAAPLGEARLAWNEKGIGISIEVRGKKTPLVCDAASPDQSDGLQVWIDTRSTQTIHRASRFCHHFCLLPRGGGRNRSEPLGVQLPIARAKELTPLCDPEELQVVAEVGKTGYWLEAWLPANTLNGYSPEDQPRLGFYYYLRDQELGEQYLTVNAEFPFAFDPSVWSVVELTR